MTDILRSQRAATTEGNLAFKKLARVSIASYASEDDLFAEKEEEGLEDEQTIVGNSRTGSVNGSSLDPQQQADLADAVSATATAIDPGRRRSSAHDEASKNLNHVVAATAALAGDSKIIQNGQLVSFYAKKKPPSQNSMKNKKNSEQNALVNRGEIVSFLVKRKKDTGHRQTPSLSSSFLSDSQTLQSSNSMQSLPTTTTTTITTKAKPASKKPKEEVILLETTDPDFYYSLAARDKFGRSFAMEELQDKVVLVKLNKEAKQQQAALAIEEEEESSKVSPSILPITDISSITPTTRTIPTDLRKKQDPEFLYSLSVLDKFGKKFNLDQLRGKVVLVVNTASKCKMATQFAEIQQMYEKYKDQGFVVLAFPTSQFGSDQEFKDEGEILQFCKLNYGVEFPIMKKIKVNGKEESVLYKYLKNVKRKYFGLKAITWNFEKFLIDRDGMVVKRSPSFFKAKRLAPTIEKLLAAAAPPAQKTKPN